MLLGMLAAPAAKAFTFSNETLHYIISYKWGIVHKDAGEATLTLRHNGPNYSIMLTGKTQPWADKFYKVRDTLRSVVKIDGLKPLSYTKITNEKGKYGRDEISFTHGSGHVVGKCNRYREKDGKVTNTSSKTLTASGPSFDMLSVFYYLRSLDFDRMVKGKNYLATIFSGKKTERLTIRYMGIQKIKLRDKRTVNAYHIKFKFTTNGKTKSSDDMDTWISTDKRNIPLLLEGSLPVGKVKCYYVGG